MKKTHLQAQKEKHEQVQEEILKILDITDTVYNNNIFDFAFEYLVNSQGFGKDMVSLLSKSKAFWDWWTVQYYIFDECFVEIYHDTPELRSAPVGAIRLHYKQRHVNADIYPDNYVFENSLNTDKQQ